LDDGFVAKYNLTNGALIWAKGLGDAWPSTFAMGLAADASNAHGRTV